MYVQKTMQRGFTFIEVVVVVAIIGILASLVLTSLGISKSKARDNSIRSSIRQLRVEAESVYNTQNGSYIDWQLHPDAQGNVATLTADIDKQLRQADSTIIRATQQKEFCISAPLNASDGHYCTDVTGIFGVATAPCPDYAEDGDPLRCEF